jgi:hypothetical protein
MENCSTRIYLSLQGAAENELVNSGLFFILFKTPKIANRFLDVWEPYVQKSIDRGNLTCLFDDGQHPN